MIDRMRKIANEDFEDEQQKTERLQKYFNKICESGKIAPGPRNKNLSQSKSQSTFLRDNFSQIPIPDILNYKDSSDSVKKIDQIHTERETKRNKGLAILDQRFRKLAKLNQDLKDPDYLIHQKEHDGMQADHVPEFEVKSFS